ncbi:MAG: ABA4-like family protein [Stackebrandtia sp.]
MYDAMFSIVFYLAAPFWLLMIVAPGWRWTHRIVSSPLIALPAAAVYAFVVLPNLADLLPAVANPTPDGVAAALSTPAGVAAGWAHFIAFDLFVGRWAYLDARERGVHPLAMAPVLIITILLGPLGFLIYLGVRALPWRKVRDERETAVA